ncbi:MAG: hypothetical protein NTY67_02115 [Cyanobacteria bacterium]|jgi:hypothetical protein|nr:hypothetical protein [Cyanobacteriota bacterium]
MQLTAAEGRLALALSPLLQLRLTQAEQVQTASLSGLGEGG